MSLLDLQRDMRGWLTREDEAIATRLGPGSGPGLRAYLNNYRAQLVACLEDSFASTRDWIGGEAFEAAVIAHIARVPPSSWTLDAYPRDFPATLAILYPGDPDVAELAWLDMALGEAFVGPDSQTLDDDLTGIDWDRAVLRFTPTIDLAELTTNATAIWSALADGAIPPGVEMLPEAGAMIVWRHAGVSCFRAIDMRERQALLLACQGVSFAALCAAMVDAYGNDDGIALAGQMLGQWLGEGLIVGIEARRSPLEPDRASGITGGDATPRYSAPAARTRSAQRDAPDRRHRICRRDDCGGDPQLGTLA
jgi:hypothetical protein